MAFDLEDPSAGGLLLLGIDGFPIMFRILELVIKNTEHFA